MWNKKMSDFIDAGLDALPFPFNCMSLVILVPFAALYYGLQGLATSMIKEDYSE